MSLLVSSPLARDAIRLLAAWVAFIVLVQAMASALGLVQGSRHLHLAGGGHAAAHHDHHDHHTHEGWERHVHASPAPGAMLVDEAQELGALAGAVLSAMVALGPWSALPDASRAGHVMRAAAVWTCTTRAAPMPDRPPHA
ncbi:MAG TPA: hypothetical protein VGD46_21465 [Rhizobacter sp.]